MFFHSNTQILEQLECLNTSVFEYLNTYSYLFQLYIHTYSILEYNRMYVQAWQIAYADIEAEM